MKFDLTSPCGDCPFRSDKPGFGLSARRVREILGGGTGRDYFPACSFPCHRTIEYVDDGEHVDDGVRIGPEAQQCAGVMIILWREGRENDVMQIAERLGLWDPATLDMSAPVYRSTEEAIRSIPR